MSLNNIPKVIHMHPLKQVYSLKVLNANIYKSPGLRATRYYCWRRKIKSALVMQKGLIGGKQRNLLRLTLSEMRRQKLYSLLILFQSHYGTRSYGKNNTTNCRKANCQHNIPHYAVPNTRSFKGQVFNHVFAFNRTNPILAPQQQT